MNPHADRLQQRAEALDREIRAEQRRPSPDSLRLQDLKRRKLAIRDVLQDLEVDTRH